MIKLGTQAGFAEDVGISEEEKYRLMSEAGFYSVDYPLMMGYQDPVWQLSDEELKEKMEKIRKVINENGIVVGQTHSPLDGYWGNQPETKNARLHAQIQAIKAASYLKSPYIVIHPLTRPWRVDETVYQEAKKLNMDYYNQLRPYLEQYRVKGAIENLPAQNPVTRDWCGSICSTAEALIDYVDTLDADCFTTCLDVGHAVLSQQDPVAMIYKLGKQYLGVTHMHDNRGSFDDHKMPGMGRIDWYAIGKALNDIEFDGIFNYEADRPYARLDQYKSIFSKEYLRVYAELGKAIVNAGQ